MRDERGVKARTMWGAAVCDGRLSGPAVSIVVLSCSTSKDEVEELSMRKSATRTVSFGKTPSCAITLHKRSALAINSAAVIPPNHLPFTVVHFFAPRFLPPLLFSHSPDLPSSLGTAFLPKEFGRAANVLIWPTTEYQRADDARMSALQENRPTGRRRRFS